MPNGAFLRFYNLYVPIGMAILQNQNEFLEYLIKTLKTDVEIK